MNKIIIILFSFLVLFSSEIINKRIFSINEKDYTSLDLDNRVNYLKLIGSRLANKEIYEDYITVILFNELFKELNLKKNQKTINEYYNIISNNETNLPKKIILQNIEYDYQRKIILENSLKNNQSFSKKINEENLSIYDTYLEYLYLRIYQQNKKKI